MWFVVKEEPMTWNIAEAARTRNSQELGRIAQELQAAAAEANALAQEYGLETCGQSQTAPVP